MDNVGFRSTDSKKIEAIDSVNEELNFKRINFFVYSFGFGKCSRHGESSYRLLIVYTENI